jgi:S-layer protein
LSATSKLVKAWEAKNAKRAAKAGGVSLMALSLAACGGSDDTTVSFTQTQLDAAVAGVDITTDNQAVIDAAVAAVDITTDNATATTLVLRDAAADAGVSGTATMTDAELITAIKTANDTAIANGVDLTTNDSAATDAAVVALGIAGVTTLAELNTAYDGLANPAASSSTLTTGANTINGTANNDTVNGVVDSNTAANDTLNAADVISMGAGTDTLNITFEVAAAAAMPSASISGVEVFNVKNVSGQTLALDMAGIDGETTLNSNLSTAIVNITNIASGTTGAVTGNGAVTNAASSFGYVAAATSSTINIDGGVTAGAITVTGTGLLAETYNSTGEANTTGTITSAATTTDVTINATTNLTAALTGTAIDTLTITGAGNVDTNSATLDATIITVNASASSGDVDVILGNVAEATDPSTVDIADVTVTGGSGSDDINVEAVVTGREISVSAGAGDDTITTGAVLFVDSGATIAGDVVDGGAGTDILSVTRAAANAQTAVTTISGIEELTISDALATGGITVANYQAGINTVNLAAGGIGEITFEAGANTVNLVDVLTAGTLALTDTGTATTDSVTIVNEDEAADAFADRTITSTGFETVNLVTTGLATAGGTNTATAQDIGVVTVTVDTGGTAVVNVSGTNIANMNGIVTAHTLNFSDLTAQAAGTATADMTGVSLEYVGATGSGTITGSAGDDVLVGDTGESTNITGGAGDDNITGGSAAETISGGAGDDTIAGGGGADTINGNDGDDSITLGGTAESVDAGAGDDTVIAAGNLTFGTTIVGGAGTADILSVNAAVSAANGGIASGFETLVVATHGGITVDVANFGNNTFTTLRMDDGTNATTLTSLAGEGVTVGAAALGADLTVTLEDATGTSDSQTITLSSAGAYDTTNDILVAGVETISLVMDDTNTTAHQNTIDLGADSATTINISGDAGVIFATGGGTDIADVLTMNAGSVVLGAVTDNGVTYAATYNTTGGVTTLTGTNGVDSLTGGAVTNDTVSGGSGVDTLVYTGGTDTFTSGAGNDVIDVNAVGAAAGSLTIADIADGDTIDLVGAVTGTIANITAANFAAAEVTLGSAATLANYLDSAADQDGSTNALLEWFEFGGDNYIVVSNDNGTTGASAGFTAGTDLAIKLTGSFNIDDSTLTTEVITIA